MDLNELRELLEGIEYGTLSRDELEHACYLIGYTADQDDTDRDLESILYGSLRG